MDVRFLGKQNYVRCTYPKVTSYSSTSKSSSLSSSTLPFSSSDSFVMLILKLEYKSKQNYYSTLFEYHILDKFTK